MQIGFIGAGNMARALARGWGRPVLASDSGSGRAEALVAELGGARLSNREVASRADLLVLAHKPYQLEAVASEIAGLANHIVSVLGGTSLAQLRVAFPGATVTAAMPNTPVEVRQGVTVLAEPGDGHPPIDPALIALFEELGAVLIVPERLLGPATSLSGVGPAYQALLAEAQIDAGIRLGLDAARATELVLATMGGTAELLRRRGGDTLAVRREVTSPGGSTARGLAALERHGIRTAFQQAADAVMDR